jgi:hypothetical protein
MCRGRQSGGPRGPSGRGGLTPDEHTGQQLGERRGSAVGRRRGVGWAVRGAAASERGAAAGRAQRDNSQASAEGRWTGSVEGDDRVDKEGGGRAAQRGGVGR